MQAIVENIVVWLSPTLALGLVWASNKLYEETHNKISFTKDVSEIKSLVSDIRSRQEGIQDRFTNLSERVDSSMRSIDKQVTDINSQFMITEKKLSAVISSFDEQEKTLQTYGRVIRAIIRKIK